MSTTNNLRYDLVITDLDNTLYDWEAFFLPSFHAMLNEVERISGVGSRELEQSFRRVYQRHRTTEYAFAIEELDALTSLDREMPAGDVRVKYAAAIDAFRAMRERTLKLYPQVRSTLEQLHVAGVRLVAHSDSVMGYVSRRLRQLDVDTLFEAISAPTDHGVPSGIKARSQPFEHHGLARTNHIEFSSMLRKPDPATLTPVLRALDVDPGRAVYVGDNLSRDVMLAESTGIASVWARYGAVHNKRLRKQLLRITYWTEADVAAEARLRAKARLLQPTFEIDSFAEMLRVVGIAPAPRSTRELPTNGRPGAVQRGGR